MDNNKAYAENFGERLSAILYDRHITQAQLAQDLKVPKGTVYNWTHGRRLPRAGAMDALCRRLQVTRAELLGEEPVPTPAPEPIPDADPMVDAALTAAGYGHLRALFAVAKNADQKDIDFVTETLKNINARKSK